MWQRWAVQQSGYFVVFEGCEGAGKSTQVRHLAETLRADGREVVVTREPGGAPAAEAIRSILLDPQWSDLEPRAEALLFAAARAEHVSALIRPALSRGAVVVCDRFIDSSLAYQGVGRGLGQDEVARLSGFATGGLSADFTVLLDVEPVVGLARAGRAGAADRIEAEAVSFHKTVRRAFLDFAKAEPGRYMVIDADIDEQTCAARVRAEVGRRLRSRGGEPGSPR